MIAFDLDGTLAEYNGFIRASHIGKPIPNMIRILKRHLDMGDECVIFTARVTGDVHEAALARHAIRNWLMDQNLPPLRVTGTKEQAMKLFYDDRAIRIIKNEGIRCCESE